MKAKYFAPAKINLTLHVTGQRDDGYHILDSLVVFADVGDWLTARPSKTLLLNVTGPKADGVPTDQSNLVIKAANLMRETADLTLKKKIPVSAGIGGGSSDAAATLFALSELTSTPVPKGGAITLGADVPVCLRATRTRVQGIGDILSETPHLPKLFAVLVNPGQGLSTPEVFNALAKKKNKPMPEDLPDFHDSGALFGWLAQQRNDLQEPAISLMPDIDTVLKSLAGSEGCRFARMSGSGATCFGLYEKYGIAKRAAVQISENHPNWWVTPTKLS